MTAATYYVGDVFDVMATLEDGSVDVVLTSPPFLALRSYLPADHPDKAKEIGSEPTPAEFLDTLLALTAEWGRLLAPHGSLCVELGDTYAGGGGGWAGVQDRKAPNRQSFANIKPNPSGGEWPLDKSLCILPELYAACLAYGRNVLTGEPSPAGQWRVRNLVRWVRPNPPVGALGGRGREITMPDGRVGRVAMDAKFRPATSVMTVACKARDRWFDLDDVRTEPQVKMGREVDGNNVKGGDSNSDRFDKRVDSNPAGAPPLDWWNIPTEPYSGSHYATWPRKLCERPIRSMCPREVCRVCGEPRRRVVEQTSEAYAEVMAEKRRQRTPESEHGLTGVTKNNTAASLISNGVVKPEYTTLGWTDCGHGDYRPGIVLDPFAGSGTTLAVATGLGRDAIGIDLDERNADLALERVGPLLLEVIDTREEVA